MFAYENFSEIYDAIAHMLMPIYVISLFVSWGNINIRYLISVVLVIDIFDLLTIDFAYSLGNEYYLMALFGSLLFFIPVLGRRLIAAKLSSRIKIFEKIQSQYSFTRQEGGLIFLYILASLINFITYIEASLFTASIITNHPIINSVYGPAISIIHLIEAFLILSLGTRGWRSSLSNKANKTSKPGSYTT
ncbi:hypothetical protein J8M21_14255 [Pseudoalteromonas luteoviolacea]|uniref:hypothetical protein n=1 Tax=Pseudoalteromonas luteoviolacea TaxID=43657 RepID=UPI001B39DE33|nr:hypothetical protein [Pseudoalteromonas luteoviolacea]MBQ4878372.1 hypothetical protein [Pseudoalteromonas luteoviolacea]MBQ4907527.1 hypothetical protein [Pseudoalteromonas luteoviolacea]